MNVAYLPVFIRQYKKFSSALQEEIDEKIALFKKDPKNPLLKVHKLKGKFADRYGFSVNYSHRVIFAYLSNTEVVLMAVGTHDIYKC